MELTKYKHIIWDWNGTLLDDLWLCVESVNQSLSRRKLPSLTQQRYQELFDFPVIGFYEQLGFDFEAESFEKLSSEYHAQYEPRWNECGLQRGAREALEAVAKAGLTQSLLSAAHQDMLNAGVAHFGLGDYFTQVCGLENKQAKGKVDAGRKMIEQLGIERGEVLLIGDTVHDYEVAQALGVDCVLVVSGHHRREKLKQCGVEVFDGLGEIFGLTVTG
ncbi:MAG: HAD family hydrolase [Planctomycetes bacterium]|nr:HAD family hydrolase [Planctomycetota bacterium]